MRIAILSDIHGNKTAFEAILTDLQQTSPDLILHGGDLADFGARPAESSTAFAISAGKVLVTTQMNCFFAPNRSKNLRAYRPRRLLFGRRSAEWRPAPAPC